jgi:hypothetical protein
MNAFKFGTLASIIKSARMMLLSPLKTMFLSGMKEKCFLSILIEKARVLLRRELGPDPADVDDASATDALIKWANGLESSENGMDLWKLTADVVDAALWVGWLFPRTKDYAGGSGQSKEDPVIILTDKTWKGIDAEYAWISKYFGQKGVDWTLVQQKLEHQGVKQFDIMQIELSNGTTKMLTFDITSFFGK